MVAKASVRSKPYASLSTATLFFPLWFCLDTERKFMRKRLCNPHWDEGLNSAKRFFFFNEKHLPRMICTPDSATRWQHTRYSSAVCERNWKFFSFDYGNDTRLSGYGWSPCPVHVGVEGVRFSYGTTAVLTKTSIVFYLGQFSLHSDWNSHILEIGISVPNQ